jgi:hypothetical protein
VKFTEERNGITTLISVISVEVMNGWSCSSTSPVFLHSVRRDKFALNFCIYFPIWTELHLIKRNRMLLNIWEFAAIRLTQGGAAVTCCNEFTSSTYRKSHEIRN